MRLPRPVIGVLPQDHDPHVPRRRRVERREPVARPRINRLALGTFAREELLERRHIGLLELAADRGEPVGMKLDLGHARLRPERRSEEHTSELQSLMRISYAVFCLKKKKHTLTS